MVLVESDIDNQIVNFGALEIQAVYTSGNIRDPFQAFISNTDHLYNVPWVGRNPPRPDWLSSVKRLIRQITVKGAILNSWNKRMAIALEAQFYQNIWVLDNIANVPPEEAQIGWYLYTLEFTAQKSIYELKLERTIYMNFEAAMERFSSLKAGNINEFTAILQKKLAEKNRRG